VKRREFITLLGGAAAWPLAVRAQQPDQMRRIGIPMPTTPADAERQTDLKALQQRLTQLGWIADRNIRIEYRWVAATLSIRRRTRWSLFVLRQTSSSRALMPNSPHCPARRSKFPRTQVGKTEITGAQCLSIESRQSPCGVRLQQRLQTAQVCFRPAQCPAPKVRPEHPSLGAFRQFPHSNA
jgi:hypothetical protein